MRTSHSQTCRIFGVNQVNSSTVCFPYGTVVWSNRQGMLRHRESQAWIMAQAERSFVGETTILVSLIRWARYRRRAGKAALAMRTCSLLRRECEKARKASTRYGLRVIIYDKPESYPPSPVSKKHTTDWHFYVNVVPSSSTCSSHDHNQAYT